MGKKHFGRSDIPMASRLLMQKFTTIKEHRDDAAKTALKVACVALNETEGMGYTRLIRFADLLQQMMAEYYEDPELNEARVNARLEQIGFKLVGNTIYGATDGDGKAVKLNKLELD